MKNFIAKAQSDAKTKRTYGSLKDAINRATTLKELDAVDLALDCRGIGETYAECSVRLRLDGKHLQSALYELMAEMGLFIAIEDGGSAEFQGMRYAQEEE
jgi:hypothetical protein